MLRKTILAAAALSAALGVSASAFAHDDHGRGWGYEKHRYVAPRRMVVVPGPGIAYAPPPAVVYPRVVYPRVVYPYPALPVYRAVPAHPAPVYSAPAISIRFNLPL